ncbi:MAG: spore coat associated protein CotJA [Clostridiales bacterium]|nr:spore coat associated protein CotJA [Clostridiales bacterium]
MKKYSMPVLPQMGPGFKLARAYIPFQIMDKIFEPWKGLMRGTIFPELYDPYPKKKRSDEN